MMSFVSEVRLSMAEPRRRSIASSDEAIAQALQEEFDSEAAIEAVEVAGVIGPAMEQLQAAFLAQLYVNNVNSSSAIQPSQGSRVSTSVAKDGGTKFQDGGQCGIVGKGICCAKDEKEGREWDMATSSSTHHSPRNAAEDDHQIALALSEDYPQVDRELARRLNDLDSTPHVPKVNGEIPPVEAASEDYQRLLDRLSFYGLTERRIAGDGNCQFRALSDQLYRSPEHHKFVRNKVVSQLTKSENSYSGYVPMEYNEYLKNMAEDGEWGDHVTLQAAADYVELPPYGVKISLITSFKDTCFIEIMPTKQKSIREIYLSFWSEVHYNSIYPLGELSGALKCTID